jgi:CheY-like chemotaxis protein
MDTENPTTPTEPQTTPDPAPAAPLETSIPVTDPAPTPAPSSEPAMPEVHEPEAAPEAEPTEVDDSIAPPDPESAAPVAAPPAPPVDPYAEPMPTANPDPAPPHDGPRRILLVEDDDSLANVYLMRLQAESFDVRRVPNGEDALAAAIEYKPDLIVLDVMMPKVSGFDVLDILRNTPETAKVKIVMLTALSQEADQARAKELGVNDYLVKSQVVIADVVDRIKYHLGM